MEFVKFMSILSFMICCLLPVGLWAAMWEVKQEEKENA